MVLLVSEAARKPGVSEKRVYDFLDEERLEAVRAKLKQ